MKHRQKNAFLAAVAFKFTAVVVLTSHLAGCGRDVSEMKTPADLGVKPTCIAKSLTVPCGSQTTKEISGNNELQVGPVKASLEGTPSDGSISSSRQCDNGFSPSLKIPDSFSIQNHATFGLDGDELVYAEGANAIQYVLSKQNFALTILGTSDDSVKVMTSTRSCSNNSTAPKACALVEGHIGREIIDGVKNDKYVYFDGYRLSQDDQNIIVSDNDSGIVLSVLGSTGGMFSKYQIVKLGETDVDATTVNGKEYSSKLAYVGIFYNCITNK